MYLNSSYLPIYVAKPTESIVFANSKPIGPSNIFFSSTQIRSPDIRSKPAPFSPIHCNTDGSCASGLSLILP